MADALIATKMAAPRSSHGLVSRPRLDDLLAQAQHARLTLVSGPAGFGKTTLIAGCMGDVMQQGSAVAWLSLDGDDDDPERFWRYVVATLDHASPGTIPDACELAQTTAMSPDAVLGVLVNELASAASDVWLVLDDYHTLQSRAVHDGMAFLLANISPRTHVVIITRADPDLPLARWRVRRELVEVRVADLRFTATEAETFLNGVSGLNLSPHDVQALGQQTEGWVAALQLAALSLQGHDSPGDFVSRFAGNDKYIVDYLVDEVLAHQDREVRDFLLSTSILDRLTGSLCDAVTGRTGGRSMLARLERANLFLFPLDDERAWYRYHHLFLDVLRSRLLGERGEDVARLHLNASRWYEENNEVEASVRHALDAEEYTRATFLMETALPSVRRKREDALLMRWLGALPDAAVRRSPVMSVFYGWMLMITGDLGGVDARLDDAARSLAEAPTDVRADWAQTDELRTLPATISIYRASLAQAAGHLDATAAHAQQALDMTDPSDHLARGAATAFLALTAWSDGDVSAALRRFTEAISSMTAAGNLADALGSTVVLADMWLVAGHPGKARRLYTRALATSEAQGVSFAQTSALLHVGLSELDLEADDLTRARWHLDTAMALDDHRSLTANHFRWFLAMGRLVAAEGDHESAIALLAQAQAEYRAGFFVEVRPLPAVTARVQISAGRSPDTRDWAADHYRPTSAISDYRDEFDHLTYVRLLLAAHAAHGEPPDSDEPHLGEASDLLDRILGPAQSQERWGSVVEIHLLIALVRDARGQRDEAAHALAAAFAAAPEPDAYTRLFLAEGEPMRALLLHAQRIGLAGAHLERILAAYERPAPSQVLVDPLSEREVQVLQLLDSDLTGPEIARTLFVSHNTVRTHTRHIFAKLQVTTRRAAVLRAGQLGLL